MTSTYAKSQNYFWASSTPVCFFILVFNTFLTIIQTYYNAHYWNTITNFKTKRTHHDHPLFTSFHPCVIYFPLDVLHYHSNNQYVITQEYTQSLKKKTYTHPIPLHHPHPWLHAAFQTSSRLRRIIISAVTFVFLFTLAPHRQALYIYDVLPLLPPSST